MAMRRRGFLTGWWRAFGFAQQERAVERERQEVEPDLLTILDLLPAGDQQPAAEPTRPAVDEPGQIAIARTPSSARSAFRVLVSEITAAFEAA